MRPAIIAAAVLTVIASSLEARAAPLRIYERGLDDDAAILSRDRNLVTGGILQTIYARELTRMDSRHSGYSAPLVRRVDKTGSTDPPAPPAKSAIPDSPPPKYERPDRTALPRPFVDRITPDPTDEDLPPLYQNRVGPTINHAEGGTHPPPPDADKPSSSKGHTKAVLTAPLGKGYAEPTGMTPSEAYNEDRNYPIREYSAHGMADPLPPHIDSSKVKPAKSTGKKPAGEDSFVVKGTSLHPSFVFPGRDP
ncbi:hypothetical protein EIP91_001362 [Steccherinum ochraceum]|uniref:Uncharacterized protein n=1 Tax=Steccherinum ochraceum TaxID=92696 RepID=A0A4R0RGK3_9APHY|nr:hypothetical protein EIP91_001362 [Steccherinum ochraceum]